MGEDKVWLPLGPLPVVAYSLMVFASCPAVGRLVLVVSRGNLERGRDLLSQLGLEGAICQGGERRQDSVQRGLDMLQDVELVAVHDGARPFVTRRLIETCYAAAARDGAAVAAIPVRDTLKRVSTEGWVEETVERSGIWAVQTPQAFRCDLIRAAYRRLDREVTDDAAAIELLGHCVRVVPGDPANVKLTTREDLEVARALVSRRSFSTERGWRY